MTASNLPCGDITPTVGITGTPVINTARSELFVVADEAATPVASHHLIGLDLSTEAVLLDEAIDPPGTDPASQLNGSPLRWTMAPSSSVSGAIRRMRHYHGLVVSAPEDGATPTT